MSLSRNSLLGGKCSGSTPTGVWFPREEGFLYRQWGDWELMVEGVMVSLVDIAVM